MHRKSTPSPSLLSLLVSLSLALSLSATEGPPGGSQPITGTSNAPNDFPANGGTNTGNAVYFPRIVVTALLGFLVATIMLVAIFFYLRRRRDSPLITLMTRRATGRDEDANQREDDAEMQQRQAAQGEEGTK